MKDDVIYRQDAIDALGEEPFAFMDYEQGLHDKWVDDKEAIEQLPSAQPEDWMEQNKDRILKAGMEGREVEFRIGGRLFAIREKAQ